MSVAVTAFVQASGKGPRNGLLVCAMLVVCVGVSIAEYYASYRDWPHPFRTAAATILSASQPSDVIFETGTGFTMPRDYIIPRQMFYYTGRNIVPVNDAPEAARYLTCHQFRRGLLAHVREDYTVERTELVLPSPDVCEPHLPIKTTKLIEIPVKGP
jgi:hypothetical protein